LTAKKSATMQDVAKRAKVSISTVSHVLNSTRNVEASTKKRILAAIDELSYRPNQLARGLRGAGSKTIGLIISDIREEFFSALTKTIESAANDRGYMVMLCDSEENPEKETSYLHLLSERGVDGVILSPVDSSLVPRLPAGRGLPMVQVDRRCERSGLDYVGLDNARCAALAVAHFASLGRSNLGFVGHEASIATMSERAEGFAKAMRDLGDPRGGAALVLHSKGSDEKARIKRWIRANPSMNGIICGNANICYAMLDAIQGLGLDVPKDMGILSFDDPECFAFMRSPITAIRQPTERLGLKALDLLLSRTVVGMNGKATELLLPGKLVVRESCGATSTRR
jgi:DNA-binding LacI/PurR family transcriptional regulator